METRGKPEVVVQNAESYHEARLHKVISSNIRTSLSLTRLNLVSLVRKASPPGEPRQVQSWALIPLVPQLIDILLRVYTLPDFGSQPFQFQQAALWLRLREQGILRQIMRRHFYQPQTFGNRAGVDITLIDFLDTESGHSSFLLP